MPIYKFSPLLIDFTLSHDYFRRRRSRSRSSSRHHSSFDDDCPSPRTILMSDQEALHQLYGEITTVRDGAVTHQCVQTNLADVICGGKKLIRALNESETE